MTVRPGAGTVGSPVPGPSAVVRRRVLLAFSVGALLVAAVVVGALGLGGGQDGVTPRVVASTGAPTASPLDDADAAEVGATTAGPRGRAVCGTDVLRSPYDYTGPAGAFRSGTPGLPTFGEPGTDFPGARAGRVLPPETADYENWELEPDTVYFLAPGTHYGSFSANSGDVFVGGYAKGRGSVLDGQYRRRTAIDSNITIGEQTNVTIQYLTIQKFTPYVDQTAINQTGAGGWRLLNSTVTLNVPGGGMFAATDAVLRDNCLTMNGQYGFQASETIRGDQLTGGPYNVWVEDNEISYNDTCGLSGLLQNEALGWRDYQPVPERYRNPHCGVVEGSGNQGGFKLWATNGVMIRDNWIHHNWGVGGWADTNNANTTWTGNTITDNENGGNLGGDLLQLLDHRQLPRAQQPHRRAGQPGLPHAGDLHLGVGERHQERRCPGVLDAVVHRVRHAGLSRRLRHRGQHAGGQRRRHLPVAELGPATATTGSTPSAP